MQKMTLSLDNKQQRPVVFLDNGLSALLDTGAYMPVWVDDEKILVENLGGKFLKSGIPLTGFGGTTKGNLYQITIKIGSLVYPNMYIIANSELCSPFNLIISATMFDGLIYEIDSKNHKLNVTIPDDESFVRNLRVKDSNGNLHVLCNSNEE